MSTDAKFKLALWACVAVIAFILTMAGVAFNSHITFLDDCLANGEGPVLCVAKYEVAAAGFNPHVRYQQ